jgi:hypothetical protein
MSATNRPNPDVLDFVRRNQAAQVIGGKEAAPAGGVERAVRARMRRLGIEEDLIGIKGMYGVDEGAFVQYPSPQGGGGLRPDHPLVLQGRVRPGINVDEAIFDAAFEALAGERAVISAQAQAAYHQAWARASVKARLDTVAAHEYAELNAVRTPEMVRRFGNRWPHYTAIKEAQKSTWALTAAARELLRLHAEALGLN